MFRKLVANLSFSPSLISELSFYAQRLKKEEFTRRLGLVFTVLALIVQYFAVFQPPESANAASSQDIVYGGVVDLQDFMNHYRSNNNNVRDIYTAAGITEQEILATREGTFNSKDVAFSAGRNSRFSHAQGERPFTYTKSDGGTGTIYFSPNRLWDTLPYTSQNGSTYHALIGHSAKVGWFAIMKNCGNLALQTIPTPPPPPPPPTCPEGTVGTPPNCATPPQPTAICSSLRLTTSGDAKTPSVNLRAQASVSNGATVSSYTYTITDSSGKSVASKIVSTHSLTSTTSIETLRPGTYTAKVTVTTSLGQKESSACQKSFVIPAEKNCSLNPDIKTDDPACQPCPSDSSIWVKSPECTSQIVQKKTAYNSTRGSDATKTTARSFDSITYTLTATNVGKTPGVASFTERLEDTLEYAEIINAGHGNYDPEAKTITWPDIQLAPGQKTNHTFTVRVKSDIPATARGESNLSSYDCIMSNTYGNTVAIPVSCVGPKVIESSTTELPHTGPKENTLFAVILFAIVFYFYMRSRQLKEEVRLVRRDANSGII